MPRPAVFELFEILCNELKDKPAVVFPETRLAAGLIEQLEDECNTNGSTATATVDAAIAILTTHFTARGSRLPFTLDAATRTYTAADRSYLDFVNWASSARSDGEDSSEFESKTATCLATRLTGSIHRIGWKRTQNRKRKEFLKYLADKMGFGPTCLEPNDKDGGLDIVWMPPLGRVPVRALVSIQCKNGLYSEKVAASSMGKASKTMKRHSNRKDGHAYFVMFNDFIDDKLASTLDGTGWIPIGLSDVAPLQPPLQVVEIL